ncbi:MAG: gliding motility-associated C-terminal domain-containing protein [Sphingobacteriales bacterium]|nr:gliding motility-associated C-terminal domain-containing protein [Sphingobacteriales bacterium]
MRKLYLLSTLVLLAVLYGSKSYSQDFSNKGKDFWLGYGYHQLMSSNSQEMVLYFATDQVTTVTVSIPGNGYSVTYANIPANTVFTSSPLPKTGAQDARLTNEQLYDRGVHIEATKPIVAYAHIYTTFVSGATLLFPTPTLGREYYSINFTNNSNSPNSNCWFYVVACDTGTTKVEITPSGTTTGGWTAGNTYVVNLTQGQIYNVMGIYAGSSGDDLTGSIVQSVSSGTGGCKRIAVFSGSGRISITCNGGAASSDYYMVQAFPKAAWGKKYLTSPTGGSMQNNIFRVCVADPTTIVKLDGAPIPYPLVNNFYYEISATSTPHIIEADMPICVAQYITSQNNCGNGNPGDPEVIYLSSVDQNIDKVYFNSTPNAAILDHYYNVIVPNGGSGLSSFTLDGVPVPAGNFTTHPGDPNYSYLTQTVGIGQHVIESDSGFNAIAYGFGNAESYGYNAGTNVKDLYQQIRVSTQYGIEQTPSVCSGSPFKFKVSLPYCADSIQWDLSNLPGPPVPTFPKFIYTTCTPGPGGPDSTSVVNGRTIYWYSLPSTYNFLPVGTYPVTITVYAPNTGGCGNVQDIDFDLEVTPPPTPDFTFSTVGCYLQPVQFTETTPQTPKPTYAFWWNFDDPLSGAANTSNLRNPTHTFSGPGNYFVRYAAITTPGCLTDTVVHQVTVADIPDATISGTTSVCVNAASPNITITATGGLAPYTFYYHINAGPAISVSGPSPLVIPVSTATPGTYTYTLDSIRNQGSTFCVRIITGQSATVTVTPGHSINLTSGAANQTVCVNTAITDINFTLGNGATGATITGLPPGVTYSVTGTTLTITGAPNTAVGSPFSYTITTTGNSCTPATSSGTIIVNPDHTLSLTSGSPTQAVCINTAISAITYTIGGGATGVNITGLPPGVTFSVAGNTVTINGSPTSTAGSPYNFTINTTGNACLQATPLNGTITVNPNHTVSLTSGNASQTVCVNNAIVNITYTLGGGATGATVTGLPAGVTFSVVGNTVTITGSPTTAVGSPFNYTINTTGNSCTAATSNGTLTVNADHSLSLTSGNPTQAVCINTAISTITYTIGGGATGVNITGLPPGVTFSVAGNTVTINGSPTSTAGSPYNFTINTTGNACLQATPLNGTITVNPNHTVSLTSGNASQTVCVNNAIVNITYTLGGGATGATVTGLPAGVTYSVVGNTVTITGSPTTAVGSPFNYTINTTGNSCTAATSNGTLTVNADHTLVLASGPANQTVCINTAIIPVTYTIGGGATGVTITGLPPGVTFSVAGNTVTITGTPSTAVGSPFNFTINTTGNACLQATPLNGSIAVSSNHVVSLTSGNASQTVCVNTPIVNITYTLGGGATGATITGLPAGVTYSVAGNTLTITGTPTTTVGSPFNFTINTTGNSCQAATDNGTLTVNQDHTISLTSAASTTSQTVCVNTAITSITYTLSGGATGATVTGLPAGVTSSVAGNVLTISGTPTTTAGSPFNYTITTTGNACVTANANGTITVTPAQNIALTSAAQTANQTVCINSSITNITYSLSGGATNAVVTGLPSGVTGSVAGNVVTISGSPTTTTGSPFSFTVTTSGNNCTPATLNGTITVNPDHAVTLSSAASTTNQTVCSDKPITTITYALGGGATGATVTGLPPGVTSSVSGNTITISGSPTTIAGSPFNYSINTTGNGCVAAVANGTITVLQTPVIQFSPVPGICADVPAFQVNAMPASGVFSGTGITSGGLFTPATAGPGNHTIRYTFTAANGCSNYQEQIISVYPLPLVNAGPDRAVIEGGQITLTPVPITGMVVTYLWTPSTYLNNPTISNPVVSNLLADITYTLLVTTDNGCSATDQVFVKLLKKVAIPNIFSPNGDGVHDTWVMEYLDSYPGCTVDVFNRYGQKIYHSEGYTKPWDGTVNGKPVPMGTYYYIVNPKNGRPIMSGYVDVIR